MSRVCKECFCWYPPQITWSSSEDGNSKVEPDPAVSKLLLNLSLIRPTSETIIWHMYGNGSTLTETSRADQSMGKRHAMGNAYPSQTAYLQSSCGKRDTPHTPLVKSVTKRKLFVCFRSIGTSATRLEQYLS